MRTRLPLTLVCLTLLFSFCFLTACVDSKQELDAMKQKVKDLNDDLKVVNGKLADMELEIDVLNEQLSSLQKSGSQSTADAGMMKNLATRLATMEGELKTVKTGMTTLEKKAKERPVVQKKAAPATSETVIEAKPEIKKNPAKTQQAPQRVKGRYYTVKRGETVDVIAATFNVSESKLRAVNRIPSGRSPIPGAKIFIPQL